MDKLSDGVKRAYHDLANDAKYQHFVRIPDRILRCIDYFDIDCDRAITRSRLHAYYLFIGVVDDAIDSGGIERGKLVLNYLTTPALELDETSGHSNVRLLTEVLKCQMQDETDPLILNKFRELYREVVSEREAPSIDSYIAHRKAVGSLTAELSCVLIRPGLSGDHERLLQFMKQVGAVGCLIDSLIDLSSDRRLGLLGFKPGMMNRGKLITCILQDGLRVSLKHPGLCGSFVRAIADNLADRFRADPIRPPSLLPERKDETAIVA
jgi:hypothetical protein